MSVTIVISLNVADFDHWKAGFDAHAEDRAEAGLNAVAHQNIDDPNNAIVIGTAPSKEAFIRFFTSPEMQAVQKDAGVLGPPDLKFMTAV